MNVQIAPRTTINAEEEIQACLNLDSPRSFFLYAGAGSGKTRSLVEALKWIRKQSKQRLLLRGQRISVITYTNAAVDEIKQRIEFDPLIEVSTIHSFAWSLISPFHTDIRNWLKDNLTAEISELRILQAKGRPGTKAALDRDNSIKSKSERLDKIDTFKRFTYSPNGDNRTKDSLSHSEVIKITASFLGVKRMFQNILVHKYPFLLIDESQDTNRDLMDALLLVQQQHSKSFCLGLFGDTMQRIYADGKIDLAGALPQNWAKPEILINYRCPGRVLKLINQVRSEVDNQLQVSPPEKDEGIVRLFLLPASIENKAETEIKIAASMAEITKDDQWRTENKFLILEHHMAAKRLGFQDLFAPLYAVDTLRTGLLDGTLSAMTLFTKDVLPLVEAMKRGDNFAAASIVKSRSPLLDPKVLKSKEEPFKQLKGANTAAQELMKCWNDEKDPVLRDILLSVSKSGLFSIPDTLQIIAARDGVIFNNSEDETEEEAGKDQIEIEAWEKVMNLPFSQVFNYYSYVLDRSKFGTHQGVKGQEFPRVLVIMDDNEARGFLFSYDKLFGAKAKSERDFQNEREGGETTIDRTRRLFYVTCSRTEKSLGVVVYTSNPATVRTQVLASNWFEEPEILLLEDLEK